MCYTNSRLESRPKEASLWIVFNINAKDGDTQYGKLFSILNLHLFVEA